MSWFGNLVQTYEGVESIAGVTGVDGNILLPLNHMIMKTNISITIDGDGKFLRAEELEERIMIPCTEDSVSRTVAIEPHPLHEQLGYLIRDETKSRRYLELLTKWHNYHPKVTAVYKYIRNGTILENLHESAIQIYLTEHDKDGKKKTDALLKKENDKINKLFVRFSVQILGDNTPKLWEDLTVCEAWNKYYETVYTDVKTLCYATGTIDVPTEKHRKGINSSTYGAKLISCNDEINYTYRGRFAMSSQANSISAKVSQKAHAMLNYLINTQGYKCDSQVIVAWSIMDGRTQPSPLAGSAELYEKVVELESGKLNDAQDLLQKNLAKELRGALSGTSIVKNISNSTLPIAIMAVDAATTGRMAITFYQSLPQNEYLERITAWHESCCWWFWYKGNEYISAPSVDKIIAAVYGEVKGKGFLKIRKQSRERLLYHIICGESLNYSWIKAAVTRTSNPFSYTKIDDSWDFWKWSEELAVACAIVRKFYIQKKEVFALELDRSYRDRSYLFGRLLAIADRLENHARYLQNRDNPKGDNRPTNAVRYMSAFASKPLRTWELIYKQLNPYIQRLDGAEWYQDQIDECMSLFSSEDICDKSLNGKYLLGYSLQRRALKKKQEEELTDESN